MDRAGDEAAYSADITPARSGNPPKYAEWRAYQISDHLVLWTAFKVDFADEYLAEPSAPEQRRGRPIRSPRVGLP